MQRYLYLQIAKFFTLLAVPFIIIACQSSIGDLSFTPAGSKFSLKTVYIQSFTGSSVEQIRTIFFDAINLQKSYQIVEILPDDFTGLGILRVKVEDHAIWENEEAIELGKDGERGKIIRRNALIKIKVSLFNANTGTSLVNSEFSQPFQQIYTTEKDIKNMPSKEDELDRLTTVLCFRMLESFQALKNLPESYEFARGLGADWISRNFYDFGNRRMMKGIEFAKAKNYDEAIWVWKIILYESEDDEPEDIYLVNRASAYYNLGIVYHRKKEWLVSAGMFSKANRLQRDLIYAQAWGDSMQTWLDEQKKPVRVKTPKIEMVDAQKESDGAKIESDLIRDLEKNNQFLLNAKELWPLDPIIKNIQYDKAGNRIIKFKKSDNQNDITDEPVNETESTVTPEEGNKAPVELEPVDLTE